MSVIVGPDMKRRMASLLIATRYVIATPAEWTKAAYALDRNLIAVMPTNPKAKMWDLTGALKKAHALMAYGVIGEKVREYDYLYCVTYEYLVQVIGSETLSEFNDHPLTTHETVIGVLEAVIKDLVEREEVEVDSVFMDAPEGVAV